MTQSGSNSNDLLLRFRVEQPAEEKPTRRISGWAMWCLLGVVMGVCGWWVSKQILVDGLSQQLTESESRSDALVTLQRLSMLGDDATEPLCHALLHQDERVAQSAYLLLDARVTAWQQAPLKNEDNFNHFAELLDVLPDDSLPTRLALASSLATRLLVFCSGQSKQDFAQAIVHCESAIKRSAHAQFRPTGEAVDPVSNVASSSSTGGKSPVPPPLPPVGNEVEQDSAGAFSMRLSDDSAVTDDESFEVRSLADGPAGSRATLLYSSTGSPGPQSHMASISLTPRPASQPTRERVVSETSAKFPVTVTDNRPAELMEHRTAISLDAPMRQVVRAPQYDLSSIPELPIGQLVRLLAAEQAKVAQTAALALKARGMDDRRIEMASRIASELTSGTRASKIKLAQDVDSSYDLDVHERSPWLLWIAEDSDPEVRKTAVGLLHGQVDEAVGRQLRSMLGYEADPGVAQTLSQVLASNPGLPLR